MKYTSYVSFSIDLCVAVFFFLCLCACVQQENTKGKQCKKASQLRFLFNRFVCCRVLLFPASVPQDRKNSSDRQGPPLVTYRIQLAVSAEELGIQSAVYFPRKAPKKNYV
jgi:hypothetical protein